MQTVMVAVYSLIADLVTVLVASALLAPDTQWFMGGLVAFVYLCAIRLGLQFWSSLKYWAGYHLFWKRRFVLEMIAQYRRGKFPVPDMLETPVQYLNEISLNEELDLKARASAAALLGELNAAKALMPFTAGIAMESGHSLAMAEYSAFTALSEPE